MLFEFIEGDEFENQVDIFLNLFCFKLEQNK